MQAKPSDELQERLARMRVPSSNGGDPDSGGEAEDLPSPDDLNWFLFRSFPGCEVSLEIFAGLLPVYETALRSGTVFDFDLLFARVVEVSTAIECESLPAIAHASARRVLAAGFDSADSIAATSFAIRTLPRENPFLDELLESESLDRLRFEMTVDFILDERDLDEYLALSYLQDGDPESREALSEFPVPEIARRKLESFFSPERCRARVEEGWEEWTSPDEREVLAFVLMEKIRGFSPGKRGPSPRSG